MTDRPNFLYIMTDQHRSDWLGCYGHPVVKTPNIDALAATGTRFDKFFVASPVCMPNRASFMTGRYPSVHGLRYNGCTLSERANTFADVLAAAGYDTASIGKSHLQPFTGQMPKHVPDPAGTGDRLIEEAWKPEPGNYAQEEPENFASDDMTDIETPYYGFDHVDLITAHGVKCGGQYQQWLRNTRPDWQDFFKPENELPHNYSCPQANRTPLPEELYSSTWVADRAIDYLTDEKRGDAPFFAFVSFPDPHHPFNPPGKYWDMYSPEDFEVTLPYAAHKNPPPPLQWMEEAFHNDGAQATPQTSCRVDDQGLKEVMALTAGMITMIDDQVGRIIATLKESGQYDNTIIVFNSDHGDYLGDFGIILKGMLPFRAVNQVPMIWSDPRDRTARVAEGLTSTIDIAPTILERAGLTPYRGMQGESFLPAITGKGGGKDSLFIEYNEGMAKHGFERPARVRTLLTMKWRFSLYLGQEWGELYDLENDPEETDNLWDHPDHLGIRGELALSLSHHLTHQMDESPRSARMA